MRSVRAGGELARKSRVPTHSGHVQRGGGLLEQRPPQLRQLQRQLSRQMRAQGASQDGGTPCCQRLRSGDTV